MGSSVVGRARLQAAARMATLFRMLVIVGAIILALFVAPPPWGLLLVGAAIIWEIAEKVFWFRYTKRIPIAVGREAMIGLPVTAITPCRPEGRVQLLGERWKARCTAGASVGDTLVIEAVDQITLVVSRRGSDLVRNM
jgi:membrane-bound ClpP family serine protease